MEELSLKLEISIVYRKIASGFLTSSGLLAYFAPGKRRGVSAKTVSAIAHYYLNILNLERTTAKEFRKKKRKSGSHLPYLEPYHMKQNKKTPPDTTGAEWCSG
jgi:hypothetical protein